MFIDSNKQISLPALRSPSSGLPNRNYAGRGFGANLERHPFEDRQLVIAVLIDLILWGHHTQSDRQEHVALCSVGEGIHLRLTS